MKEYVGYTKAKKAQKQNWDGTCTSYLGNKISTTSTKQQYTYYKYHFFVLTCFHSSYIYLRRVVMWK